MLRKSLIMPFISLLRKKMYWHYSQKFLSASFDRATGVYKEIFLELVDIIDSYKHFNRKYPNSLSKAILNTLDTILLM